MSNYPHVSEITPGILTQKHVRADYLLIKTGLASERPTKGNQYLSLWFSSDTFVLSYWDKTSKTWVDGVAFN